MKPANIKAANKNAKIMLEGRDRAQSFVLH